MAGNVLVFIEVRNGKVKTASLETVSEAKRHDVQIACVLVGTALDSCADAPVSYGADRVFLVEEERLNLYAAEAYAKAVAEAARAFRADAIFMAATSMGKDLGPSVAALFDTGVATDCVGLFLDGSRWIFRRPVYAGKAFVEGRMKKMPVIASLRPNVFPLGTPDLTRGSSIEALKVPFTDADFRGRVREIVATSKGKIELTEAAIVVSGGRGLKGPEHFHLRDELAEVLGAAVGASRAVVDAGWRPHSEQVGQTGKTVSPNLYIAIGISGAIQHLAGMASSKVIVAINKDADAPIFKKATYGIVGDAFEVAPALTQELRKLLQT